MARYLIDSHIYIWSDNDVDNIPLAIQNVLADPSCEVYFSLVSLWEMQIKTQLGKLYLKKPLDSFIKQLETSGLYPILPITQQHILALRHLPMIHKDPFDRLLIAQAMVENLTLLTVDEDIIQYPIQVLY